MFIWFLFGICVGSFLNVIIYRLDTSIFFGKSICPKCKSKIKWYDLIPILSFFILGSRCRSCKAKISLRYPFVELLCGLLAMICVYKFSFTLNAFVVFLFLCCLVATFFVDIDKMIIPDSLILFLIFLAVIFTFIFDDVDFISRCIGFFSISSFMFALNFFVKESFGFGDIKLIAVCGYILGLQNILLAFFISLITASLFSVFLIITKRKSLKDYIPFGPHICFGVALSFFCGIDIINWYLFL